MLCLSCINLICNTITAFRDPTNIVWIGITIFLSDIVILEIWHINRQWRTPLIHVHHLTLDHVSIIWDWVQLPYGPIALHAKSRSCLLNHDCINSTLQRLWFVFILRRKTIFSSDPLYSFFNCLFSFNILLLEKMSCIWR